MAKQHLSGTTRLTLYADRTPIKQTRGASKEGVYDIGAYRQSAAEKQARATAAAKAREKLQWAEEDLAEQKALLDGRSVFELAAAYRAEVQRMMLVIENRRQDKLSLLKALGEHE